MNRLDGLLQYGDITMSKENQGYSLIFEPDIGRNPSFKRTTFLITRKCVTDLIDALELYLNDQYRGANDYPASFFDSDG